MLQDVIDGLSNGIIEITFEKSDKTERVMKATRSPTFIAADKVPADLKPATVLDKSVRVFDVDLQEWRSFNTNKLLTYKVIR